MHQSLTDMWQYFSSGGTDSVNCSNCYAITAASSFIDGPPFRSHGSSFTSCKMKVLVDLNSLSGEMN